MIRIRHEIINTSRYDCLKIYRLFNCQWHSDIDGQIIEALIDSRSTKKYITIRTPAVGSLSFPNQNGTRTSSSLLATLLPSCLPTTPKGPRPQPLCLPAPAPSHRRRRRLTFRRNDKDRRKVEGVPLRQAETANHRGS